MNILKHLAILTLTIGLVINLHAQQQEHWERVALSTKEVQDFFATKIGDPNYPEAGKFLGGEGGQWPQAIAISSDASLLLWGTDVGGIARSLDEGATWEPCNIGFNARGGIAFAIDPKNPNRAIALGGNSSRDWPGAHGIYLTTDKAATWSIKKAINISGYRDIREQIAYDASSYDATKGYCSTIYYAQTYLAWYTGQGWWDAATMDRKRIWKSTDGGSTWNMLQTKNSDFADGIIKVNPDNGQVYTATPTGFFKSTDKGVTFTKTVDKALTGFDILKVGSTVKLFISSRDGLLTSVDGGETFQPVSSSNYPKTSSSFMAASFLKVSPADPNNMYLQIEMAQYNTPRYCSNDGGKTWFRSNENTNNLAYLPVNGGRLGYCVWHPTDKNRAWAMFGDCMMATYDGGKNFRWAHNGLPALMHTQFSFSTVQEGVFVIPTQDYDLSVTSDNGKTFTYLNLSRNGWGGWFYGAYSPDGNRVVGINKDSNGKHFLAFTPDRGKTANLMPDKPVAGCKMAYGDPNDANIFFAGEWRSEDAGANWTKMIDCDGVFTSCPTGMKELYGVKLPSTVVKSIDRGATWLAVGQLSETIADLAYDHKNNRCFVASTGNNLFEMNIVNGEVINITARVPKSQFGANRIFQVAVDPINPEVVYCAGPGHIYANDASVCRSVDGGKTFISLNRSPRFNNPEFGIDGAKEGENIRVNPMDGYLYVGTSCYGSWKIGPPNANLIQGNLPDLYIKDIYCNPTTPMQGDTVTITILVRNTGSTATNEGDNLKVKLTINGVENHTTNDYLSQLKANEEIELSVEVPLSEGGLLTLNAEIDADNLISEKNERNNTQVARIMAYLKDKPAVPENLRLLSKNWYSLKVGWDKSDNKFISGYAISVNGLPYSITSSNEITIEGLDFYNAYTIDVVAVDVTGNRSEAASATFYTAANSTNLIKKTAEVINVDGMLNETSWDLNYNSAMVVQGSSSNNSVTFGTLWTNEFLYVGIKVMDDQLYHPSTTEWKNDGTEVYLDGDHDKANSYKAQDMAVGKSITRTAYGIQAATNWQNVQVDEQIGDGGYTQEYAIPWSALENVTPAVGKIIGISVEAHDNDDNMDRLSKVTWQGNGDTNWESTANLGEMMLVSMLNDTIAPLAPGNLQATRIGSVSADIEWDESIDLPLEGGIGVQQYFVFLNGIRIAVIQAGDALHYQFNQLQQGTSYEIGIRAVDLLGNVSQASEKQIIETITDLIAPNNPIDLKLIETGNNFAVLSWKDGGDNVGTSGYKIYQNGVEKKTSTETQLKITGLTKNKEYKFIVKAIDEVGNISENSNELSVTLGNVSVIGLSEMEKMLKVFPNPANNFLYVQTENLQGNSELSLLNLSGEVLFSKKTINPKIEKIELSTIPSGVYFIKIMGEQTFYRKVIVNRN